MDTIKIKWMHDEYDCETCGPSYASGAIVYKNDEILFELLPVAHCYSGDSYETDEVYKKILDIYCTIKEIND